MILMSEGVHNVIDEHGIMLKSVKKEFNNISDGVRYLMLNDERCKNDDLWLEYKYARAIEGIDIHIPYDEFQRMMGLFPTIERCRRKIQEEALKLGITKLLPTDPEIFRKRHIREEVIRKWIPTWHPDVEQEKIDDRMKIL